MSRTHSNDVSSKFPILPSAEADRLSLFESCGPFSLWQRGIVGTLSHGGQDTVRIARWTVNPHPSLPTGYVCEYGTSALHVIVKLAASHPEPSAEYFQGFPIVDHALGRQIILVQVLTSGDWKKEERRRDLLNCKTRQIQEHPEVLWAEPNYLEMMQANPASVVPNDPAFAHQWGLGAIRATEAWAKINQVELLRPHVAIIDSGVDPDHPDLRDNIELHEAEKVHFNCFKQLGRGAVHSDIMDEPHSHGTFCTGVLGAMGNNEIGIAGVNWRPIIRPIKFIGPHGNGTVWDASQAIRAAVDRGAKIILAAWGMNIFSHCLYDACKYAMENGALIVTAAGNLGQDLDRDRFYPACFKIENGPFSKVDRSHLCDQCLSAGAGHISTEKQVGCTTNETVENPAEFVYEGLDNIVVVAGTQRSTAGERKAGNSSWGKEVVDLGAPGHFIRTTRNTQNGHQGTLLDWASGTSLAAAFVAGALALLKARFSGFDYRKLKARLLGTARQLPALEGYWPHGRRLDLYRAVVADEDEYGEFQVPGEDPVLRDASPASIEVELKVQTNGNGNAHSNGYLHPRLRVNGEAWQREEKSGTAAHAK